MQNVRLEPSGILAHAFLSIETPPPSPTNFCGRILHRAPAEAAPQMADDEQPEQQEQETQKSREGREQAQALDSVTDNVCV